MNNYCRNCGNRLTNTNMCEVCQTPVVYGRVGVVDKALFNHYLLITGILAIIFVIILALYSILAGSILNILGFVFIAYLLATIIFIAYAKIKLKYSVLFTILFWFVVMCVIVFSFVFIITTIIC